MSVTYTTAHSNWILNALSEARGQTHSLVDTSRFVSAAPQWELPQVYFWNIHHTQENSSPSILFFGWYLMATNWPSAPWWLTAYLVKFGKNLLCPLGNEGILDCLGGLNSKARQLFVLIVGYFAGNFLWLTEYLVHEKINWPEVHKLRMGAIFWGLD